MAKHRASRNHLRRTPRAIITATAVLAGAVVLGLAGAGGTYALWNNSITLSPGTITSGTTGLTVNGQTAYPIPSSDMVGQLLPGSSRITIAPLAVKNTGTPPLSVTAATPVITGALAGQLVVAIRPVASATSACTPTPVGGVPTSLSTAVTIAPGATIYVCVEVQLKTSAPSSVQNQSGAFNIPLNAVQVRP